MAFVSCVSPTFFQPVGSGSHLYTANRNTLRSRTLSSRSYMTLVGQPLLSGCLASLICILIISQTLRFVKTFLIFFCWRCDSNAHHPFADSTEDTSHRWENPTRTGGVAYRGTLRNRSTPSVFCTLIVSHFKGFVKRKFQLS